MENKSKFKQSPFTMPQDYFDGLEQDVLQKIKAEKQKQNRNMFWISSMAAAAAVLLLFIWIKPFNTAPTLLSALEIETYFEQNGTAYDEMLIYQNLPEQANENLSLEEQNEIIEYLSEDSFENELFLEN